MPTSSALASFVPGAVAGDQVVGVLRDRAGHLAAGGADQPRRLVAGEARQGAGEDEGLSLERAALGAALRRRELEAQPALAQALDQLEHGLVGELLAQRLGQHRADPLGLGDLLGVGRGERSIEPKCSASEFAFT